MKAWIREKAGSIILCFVLILCGCDEGIQKGNELKPADIAYIRSIGLLEEDEEIIYFSSNYGTRESGNFLTGKRIASYWIHGKEDKKNTAFFEDIDSIKVIYMPEGNESTSRIEVYQGRSWFNVYIDDERKAENAFVAELERRIGLTTQERTVPAASEQ